MTASLLRQSSSHQMMIEPSAFHANPETMATNVYQVDEAAQDKETIAQNALGEFRAYRDSLISAGVLVTTTKAFAACPDMVFPNWVSTHREAGGLGTMVLYPMQSANRRVERDPAMIDILHRSYPDVIDWTHYEQQGLFLESTGSLCLDRVNKVAYVALSARTSENLAREWAALMGYEVVVFETKSHTGKPVYHTDLVMHIGTSYAAVCADCIEGGRGAPIADRLRETHDVVLLDMEQLQSFCGNALEVVGADGRRYLTMSAAAKQALRPAQLEVIARHFAGIIDSPLPTLERYGGGSARCTLLELF